jgi:hypothetical protein
MTNEPSKVSLLAGVIDETVKALDEQGCVMPSGDKKAIAQRVMDLYNGGVTDPDRLLLMIMADSMWASSSRSLMDETPLGAA